MRQIVVILAVALLLPSAYATVVVPSGGSGGDVYPGGDCASGYVVQNTTTGGVECVELPTETSPGGSDGQIQFNDRGSFGGTANFTYNDSEELMKLQYRDMQARGITAGGIKIIPLPVNEDDVLNGDGDFNDPSDFDTGTSWTVSGGKADTSLTAGPFSGTTDDLAYIPLNASEGFFYNVTLDVDSFNAGISGLGELRVVVGGNGIGTMTSTGTYNFQGRAEEDSEFIVQSSSTAGCGGYCSSTTTATVDNFVIKKKTNANFQTNYLTLLDGGNIEFDTAEQSDIGAEDLEGKDLYMERVIAGAGDSTCGTSRCGLYIDSNNGQLQDWKAGFESATTSYDRLVTWNKDLRITARVSGIGAVDKPDIYLSTPRYIRSTTTFPVGAKLNVYAINSTTPTARFMSQGDSIVQYMNSSQDIVAEVLHNGTFVGSGFITQTYTTDTTPKEAYQLVDYAGKNFYKNGVKNYSAWGECEYTFPERVIVGYENVTTEEWSDEEQAIINITYQQALYKTRQGRGIDLDCKQEMIRLANEYEKQATTIVENGQGDTILNGSISMWDEIHTKSKVPSKGEKHLKKFDDSLNNKETHFAYKNETNSLSVEDRLVALEGSMQQIHECIATTKSANQFQTCVTEAIS